MSISRRHRVVWWVRGTKLWWWLRGVTLENYRQVCTRCGQTGQAHWRGGCWRFKP